MRDWNVLITTIEGHYRQAMRLLEPWGKVERTAFFNVIVMKAGDPMALLEQLRKVQVSAAEADFIFSRVIPVTKTFSFQDREEFRQQAREVILGWLPELAGNSFHTRMHRRGFKGLLNSQEEEQYLNGVLLQAALDAGTPARVSFKDPDAVVTVETVGNQAGMALQYRQERCRYEFLKTA